MALAACLLAGCVSQWSRETQIEEGVFAAVRTANWLQEQEIARHPQAYYEKNSLLGEGAVIGSKPSSHGVTWLVVGTIAVHGLVTDQIERRWPQLSRFFEGVTVGANLEVIVANYELGLRF